MTDEATRPRGEIRRFGSEGPLYEVISSASRHGEPGRVRVRVIESGEEVDYPLAALVADPVVF